MRVFSLLLPLVITSITASSHNPIVFSPQQTHTTHKKLYTTTRVTPPTPPQQNTPNLKLTPKSWQEKVQTTLFVSKNITNLIAILLYLFNDLKNPFSLQANYLTALSLVIATTIVKPIENLPRLNQKSSIDQYSRKIIHILLLIASILTPIRFLFENIIELKTPTSKDFISTTFLLHVIDRLFSSDRYPTFKKTFAKPLNILISSLSIIGPFLFLGDIFTKQENSLAINLFCSTFFLHLLQQKWHAYQKSSFKKTLKKPLNALITTSSILGTLLCFGDIIITQKQPTFINLFCITFFLHVLEQTFFPSPKPQTEPQTPKKTPHTTKKYYIHHTSNS